MKQPDSEALKQTAEADRMKAVDDLLNLMLNPQSGPQTSAASPRPQEA